MKPGQVVLLLMVVASAIVVGVCGTLACSDIRKAEACERRGGISVRKGGVGGTVCIKATALE